MSIGTILGNILLILIPGIILRMIIGGENKKVGTDYISKLIEIEKRLLARE